MNCLHSGAWSSYPNSATTPMTRLNNSHRWSLSLTKPGRRPRCQTSTNTALCFGTITYAPDSSPVLPVQRGFVSSKQWCGTGRIHPAFHSSSLCKQLGLMAHTSRTPQQEFKELFDTQLMQTYPFQ